MATAPRRLAHRAVHTRYGLKTGEPGAQVVDTGSLRATLDAVGEFRWRWKAKAFPTPKVDVYAWDGRDWSLHQHFDFATESRRS